MQCLYAFIMDNLPFITTVIHSGVFLKTKETSKGELMAPPLLDRRLQGTGRRLFFF